MEEGSWKRSLLLLCIIVFLGAAAYATLRLIIPLYVYEVGYSYTEVGLTSFATGILYTVSAIPLGKASDRVGRRAFILSGLVGIAICALAYQATSSLINILLISGFLGVVSGAWWPIVGALMAELAPAEKRGFVMGVYGTSWSAAYAVGPMVGGFILDLGGFSFAFVVCSVMTVATAFLVLKMRLHEKVGGLSGNVMGRDLVSSEDFLQSSLGGFAYGVFIGILFTIFPVFLKSISFTAVQIGLALLVFGLVRTFTFFRVGMAGDVFGQRRILMAGLVGCSFTLALIGFAEGFYQFLAVMVLVGVAVGAVYPAAISLAVGENGRGFRVGVYESFLGGGICLGPLVGGVLADNIDVRTPYYFCAAVGLLVVCLLIFSKRGASMKPH